MRTKLLWRYLTNRKGAAGLLAVLLLAASGLQLAGPQVIRIFLDQVQGGAPLALLYRTALAFLAASAAAQGAQGLAAYWADRIAWSACNDLRLDLTAHLLGLDAAFHKERTPGELIERIDGDVSALAGAFSSMAVQLLGSALFLAGILVALSRVSLELGLAFAAFAGALAAVLWLVRRKATPWLLVSRARSADYYGFLGELVGAAEELRACGAGAYALGRISRLLSDWYPVLLQGELWGGALWMVAIAAFSAADGLTYAVGGHLFRAGSISLGTVYLVMRYTAALEQPIETIRQQLQDLQRADAALARLGELMALTPAIAGGDRRLPGGALAVELEGVSFRYGEDGFCLQDLSFRLAPGQILGVAGRTGSGKSTLARLLCRFCDPEAGSVKVGGVDLRQVDLSSLRSRVAWVTQEVQLLAATLRDNITLFDPAISDERLSAVLIELGLGPWLARLPGGLNAVIVPGALSAGEAQLLALARAFLGDPGLVILDEASSRLDPETEALAERALDGLLRGRTGIIIAHRPESLRRADSVLVLEDGRPKGEVAV